MADLPMKGEKKRELEKSLNNRVLPFIKKQTLIIFLLLLVAFFGILSDRFFTLNNIISITRQVAIYGIMSCGMTFALIGGNFDLTAGAIVSLTCIIAVRLHDQIGALPAIAIALVVGIIFGSITGFLVGHLKLTSLITTLGMKSILSATAMIYTQSKFFTVADPDHTWYRFLGREYFLGIPIQVYLYVIFIVIFQYILRRSKFGYQVKAVGGNRVASHYSGINDKKMVMKTFILSGFCAAIAGIILGSRSMTAQVGVGEGFEFDVITACILSGTSLLGGSGSVSRAFIGVLIMGVLANGFVMVGLPYYFQWMAQCVIIVAAVWLDIASKKKVLL